MPRPRPAAAVLLMSALVLGGSLTALTLAGPGTTVENAGSRPAADTKERAVASATSGRRAAESSPPKLNQAVKAESKKVTPRNNRSDTYKSGNRTDATILPRRDLDLLPVEVSIGSIRVKARVTGVGLRPDKQVEVPHDVSTVGWYTYSQLPGAQRGSSVLVGHRDGKGQGPGAFYNLGQLDIGDRIEVRTAGKRTLVYRVVAREAFRKQQAPLADLFSSSGEHRLTLITCGGPFDPSQLGYTDNIVISAILQSV